MTAPGGWTDPELADLFAEDPGLEETAQLLRASRPDPEVDPHFQRRLRGQLMQAAAARPQRTKPALRVRAPFWMRLRASHFAWGGAAAGVALTAATIVALVTGGQGRDRQTTIVATSPVAAQHLVSPTNTITVSFNQPMNHSSVESGLKIEPATQVTTSWQVNDLVITPVHHLSGNTTYSVTIAQPALVSSSGARATAPVQINFGTAPTPPPAPTPTIPVLTTTDLGVAQGGLLLFAPDGGLVINAPPASGSTPQPSATPSPSPTASPSPKPSPSASPTPVVTPPSPPALAPSPAPVTGPALEELSPGVNTPVVLGPAATSASFSPDGNSLASVVTTTEGGGGDVLLSRADGTGRRTLYHSANPIVGIAWTSAGKIEFATAQAVSTLDSSGVVQTIAQPSGTITSLSPTGGSARLAPTATSPAALYDLTAARIVPLQGATASSPVAFSGDGTTVAWIDASAGQPRLLYAPPSGGVPSAVAVLDPAAQLGPIALSRDASEIAYGETMADGTGKVVLAQLPLGTPLATAPTSELVGFSPRGDMLALLQQSGQGTQALLAPLPGTTSTTGPAVPAGASQVLHAFLDAQVRGDHGALSALSQPGVVPSLLPANITRASLIDEVVQHDGSVRGIASLASDPTTARLFTLITDETLTVAPSGGSYVVTALNTSQPHQQPAGPHVVGVTSSQKQGKLTVVVAFDSDLVPSTVPDAITLQQVSGAALPATVTYDQNSRTATVTLNQVPGGALSVVVGTTLRDVNGAAPLAPFSAPIVAG